MLWALHIYLSLSNPITHKVSGWGGGGRKYEQGAWKFVPTFLPVSIIGRPFSLAHSCSRGNPDVFASINFYGVVQSTLEPWAEVDEVDFTNTFQECKSNLALKP